MKRIEKSLRLFSTCKIKLAEHNYFTEEESDFITNIVVKYEMGKELDNGEIE